MSGKNNKDVELIVSMPEETTAETFLKIFKNIADIFVGIPIVGASISKFLEQNLSIIYQRRFDEFVENINQALQHVPEKIYSSEEFAEVTRITLKNYLEETSATKRGNIFKIYYYFLINGFVGSEEQNRAKESILDSCLLWEKVAAGLSEGSFLFFLEIKANQDTYGKEDCTEWWGKIPARTLTPVYIGELVTFGLIEQVMSYRPSWDDVNQKTGYHISQAGEEFLTWLDMNSV